MSVDPSALQVAAQRYSDLGLCVIPLPPMDKHPALSRWQQYQRRRPTDAEREDWFSRPRNIAVVCGEISGGLVGLDFDDPRAFAYCFPDHRRLADETFVVETSRGVGHVYARLKGGGKPKSTTFKKRPGARSWLPLDVQGEGKYLVAPPSVHPSGKSYRFVGGATGIMEVESYDELIGTMRARSEEWPFVEAVFPAWTESSRHNTALGFAKVLRFKQGFAPERVEDIVRRVCHVVGDPEERDRIRAVRDTIAKGPEETAGRVWLGDEVFERLSALVPKRRKPESPTGEREPAEHAKFVTDLMAKFTFATMDDTDEVLVYESGVYRKGAESLIRAKIELQLIEEDDSARTKLTEEVVDAIRRRTYRKREDFNPPGKLCLENGVLDLGTLSVSPHATNERFTIQLPVGYDPGAACPKWETFLMQVLPDEGARRTVRRLFGYCLEPGNPYQVAFMCVGIGDNGKSTALRILATVLGRDNIASEPLQTLTENRFAAAQLWDKLANVCADIPATGLRSTGMFKMLTGGDLVRGEQKFREAFYFENPAKLVFSANVLPDVNDKTLAFWRRWGPGLIRFPINVNDLPGGKDPHLLEKLLSELPGILNWALDGLRELREAGGFERTGGDLEREWKRRADSLYWFISECIEVRMGEYTPKADFYEAYVSFAEDRGATVKKPEIVGKELPGLIPQVRSEQRRVDEGKRVVRVWANAILKSLPEPHSLDSPASEVQKRLPVEPAEAGDAGEAGLSNDVRVDQHPDYMAGLERALEVRRHDPKRPVHFIVGDLVKELRSQACEPDIDQLTAGVITGMMPEAPP